MPKNSRNRPLRDPLSLVGSLFQTSPVRRIRRYKKGLPTDPADRCIRAAQGIANGSVVARRSRIWREHDTRNLHLRQPLLQSCSTRGTHHAKAVFAQGNSRKIPGPVAAQYLKKTCILLPHAEIAFVSSSITSLPHPPGKTPLRSMREYAAVPPLARPAAAQGLISPRRVEPASHSNGAEGFPVPERAAHRRPVRLRRACSSRNATSLLMAPQPCTWTSLIFRLRPHLLKAFYALPGLFRREGLPTGPRGPILPGHTA